jgi:hypothetical protein
MSVSIWLAYLLSILAAILCVVYGILKWNKGAEKVSKEDIHWAEEEKKIEKEFE